MHGHRNAPWTTSPKRYKPQHNSAWAQKPHQQARYSLEAELTRHVREAMTNADR